MLKIDKYGNKFWKKSNPLHRINGPAAIYKKCQQNNKFYFVFYKYREKEYYQNGQHHRINGPSIIDKNRTKFWIQKGLLHRMNGPAIINKNGEKEWYQNNEMHRINGPAVENSLILGTRYYVNNKKHMNYYFKFISISKSINKLILEIKC